MKKLAFLVAAITLFAACEKSIPVVDPTALDNRNIYARVYKFWNNSVLDTSEVLTINGSLVKLDHMYITLSGFEYVSYDGMDTVRTETDLTMVDLLATQEVKLGYLPRGSYNGHLYYNIGLDSTRAHTAPENFEETNPLRGGLVWNGGDVGHSFLQIEGRIFDGADTTFTTPKDQLVWRIATEDMVITRREAKNFNVTDGMDVFFVINLDVEKLFSGLIPAMNPVILSDPADGGDFNMAGILRDNLASDFNFKL